MAATDPSPEEIAALKVNALEKPLPPVEHEERIRRATATELPPRWTADHVCTRLVEAFAALGKLPLPRGPKEPGNHWGAHRYEFADVVGWNELPPLERRARDEDLNQVSERLTSRQIAEMEHALEWLRWLRHKDQTLARILGFWAATTARGKSLRSMCRSKSWSRMTVERKRMKGAALVAADLNEKRLPVF